MRSRRRGPPGAFGGWNRNCAAGPLTNLMPPLAALRERDDEPLRAGRTRRGPTRARAARACLADAPRTRRVPSDAAATSPPATASPPPRNARRDRSRSKKGSGVITSILPSGGRRVGSGRSSRVTVNRSKSTFRARRVAPLGAARATRHRLGRRTAARRRASAAAARCSSTATPRVACVTPATRVAGRAVTTVEGLDPAVRRTRSPTRSSPPAGRSAGSARPGSSCAPPRCRPRARTGGSTSTGRSPRTCAGAPAGRPSTRRSSAPTPPVAPARDLDAAAQRAALEGGVPQRGRAATCRSATGGFADDRAPRDALVAVPLPARRPAAPTRSTPRGCRGSWPSRCSRRGRCAGKVQGRRTTAEARVAARPSRAPAGRRAARHRLGGARVPRARRVVVRARRRARRRRSRTAARSAARTIARWRRGRARARRPLRSRGARRLLARRRRAPRAEAPADRRAARATTTARSRSTGVVVGAVDPFVAPIEWPYRVDEVGRRGRAARVPGPPTSSRAPRGRARRARGAPRGRARRRGCRPSCARRVTSASRARCSTPASRVVGERRALAGARVDIDDDGTIARVAVRVAAGDPLDEVVLRSYAIGAAHMALGWVLTEGLTVDPETGRGARPHHPVVRRRSARRTRRRSTSRSSTTTGPPLAACVRRGVRRGRRGRVERDHARRRRASRRVPRVGTRAPRAATPLTPRRLRRRPRRSLAAPRSIRMLHDEHRRRGAGEPDERQNAKSVSLSDAIDAAPITQTSATSAPNQPSSLGQARRCG